MEGQLGLSELSIILWVSAVEGCTLSGVPLYLVTAPCGLCWSITTEWLFSLFQLWNDEVITDTAIPIYRQVVIEILRCIDLQGVQLRATHCLYSDMYVFVQLGKEKRRLNWGIIYVVFIHIFAGLNYIWHIDWNDKLKLHGSSIHDCIDGSE